MSFLDGNALSCGATAELFDDCGLDVADEKLRHVYKVLSMIPVRTRS
jgi:hypothetical protein